MTKVITRYFESEEKTYAVKRTLQFERFPRRDIKIFTDPDGLLEKLAEENVNPDTAKAYQKLLKKGGAVFLARATYKPLGAPKLTRDLTAKMGAVDMGDLVQEVFIRDKPGRSSASILNDHPLFLTRTKDQSPTGYYMADWPIPLISRRKPANESLFPRHARMANWPIDLLAPANIRYGRFPFDLLVPGQKFMANFPIGHLVSHNRRYGRFPFGLLVPGQKFMAKFPIGHIVPGHKFMAKFPFAHLVPGHKRMANWPFPLLINGKQGENSLVPGQKFMAKFPFAHLVPGHKFMAKFPFGHIVPGHKFMAKFPFGHIVPGHKYKANFPFGHIVPGHKYMANFIWPHTKSSAS